MNVTERVIAEAPGRHCDVRPTSTGGDWPYGVVLYWDNLGNILYSGFHPGMGLLCSEKWYTRQHAIREIQLLAAEVRIDPTDCSRLPEWLQPLTVQRAMRHARGKL